MRKDTGISKKQAKEHLDQLIEQEAADNATFLSHNFSQKAPQSEQSSHVLDLRKQYLIQKYQLDTIAPPERKKGKFFKRKKRDKIAWHVPESVQQKDSQPFYSHITEAEAELNHTHYDESNDEIEFKDTIKYSRKSALGFAIILLLVVTPLIGAPHLFKIDGTKNTLVAQSASALDSLSSGISSLQLGDFDTAQDQLGQARTEFHSVRQYLTQYSETLLDVSQHVPVVGNQVAIADLVTASGESIADALYYLSLSLESEEDDVYITDSLHSIRLNLNRISSKLKNARPAIKDLDPSIAPQWVNQITFLRDNIDRLIAQTDKMVEVIALAETMLGSEKLQRYLLLFQNSRELRPTGGFIGSYALADFSRGSLRDLEMPGGGTYDLEGAFNERLIPPKPISIVNRYWHLWDANWWIDFPTSAKKLAWFYEHANGPTIDGVIAVNSDLMIDLLEATGPIEMPEYDLTVSSENFYDVIQEEVEFNYDPDLNQPKKILKDLVPRLMDRLVDGSNAQSILTVMINALSSKNIQMYHFDPAVQQKITELGWSGSLGNNDRDFLSVVSTNIAGGKSDAAIYQNINHEAVITHDGHVDVTVTITKEHRGVPSDPLEYVNNVDYMRFYVPQGSKLLDASGFKEPPEELYRQPDQLQIYDSDLLQISGLSLIDRDTGVTQYNELGKTVYAHWFQVEPGEKAQASITYQLPFLIVPSVESTLPFLASFDPSYREVDKYSLLVHKQPGKNNTILNSTVRYPDNFTVVWSDSVNHSQTSSQPGVYSVSADLKHDIYYAMLLTDLE